MDNLGGAGKNFSNGRQASSMSHSLSPMGKPIQHSVRTGRSLPSWVAPVLYVACGVIMTVVVARVWSFDGSSQFSRIYAREPPERTCEVRSQLHELTFRPDLDYLRDVCEVRYNVVIPEPRVRCQTAGSEREEAAIPQFRVLGERHSGTNAMRETVYANFKVLDKKTIDTNHTHGPYFYQWPRFDFGITEHKHDEQTQPSVNSERLAAMMARSSSDQYQPGVSVNDLIGLTVVAVREPYSWVQSMSKQIYGGQDRNKFDMGEVNEANSNRTYAEAIDVFLSTSWEGGDHVFGTVYANLFDMRYRKVCNHLWSSLAYSQNVAYIRTEDVMSAGSKLAFVDAVARWTGWRAAENVDTGEGRYFGHSHDFPHEVTRGEGGERGVLVEAVNRYADRRIERALGHVLTLEGDA